jgi:hypothetical protein
LAHRGDDRRRPIRPLIGVLRTPRRRDARSTVAVLRSIVVGRGCPGGRPPEVPQMRPRWRRGPAKLIGQQRRGPDPWIFLFGPPRSQQLLSLGGGTRLVPEAPIRAAAGTVIRGTASPHVDRPFCADQSDTGPVLGVDLARRSRIRLDGTLWPNSPDFGDTASRRPSGPRQS